MGVNSVLWHTGQVHRLATLSGTQNNFVTHSRSKQRTRILPDSLVNPAMLCIDFKFSRWLIIDAGYVLGLLHRGVVGDVSEFSEVYAASCASETLATSPKTTRYNNLRTESTSRGFTYVSISVFIHNSGTVDASLFNRNQQLTLYMNVVNSNQADSHNIVCLRINYLGNIDRCYILCFQVTVLSWTAVEYPEIDCRIMQVFRKETVTQKVTALLQ